jgi:hypothetical protein
LKLAAKDMLGTELIPSAAGSACMFVLSQPVCQVETKIPRSSNFVFVIYRFYDKKKRFGAFPEPPNGG